MSAFRTTEAGTCGACSLPVEVGDLVVWINDGMVHLECEDPEKAIAKPIPFPFDVDTLQAQADGLNAAIATMVGPIVEHFEKVLAMFVDLAHTLGVDTNRGRRRWRKAIAIHEHQKRKAARIPAWKRGHDA